MLGVAGIVALVFGLLLGGWETHCRSVDSGQQIVATHRARVRLILFIQHPRTGAYLDHETKAFRRRGTWVPLLAQNGAKGIHFADHLKPHGFELPEWSHLSHESARRYSAVLYGEIARVEPTIVAR